MINRILIPNGARLLANDGAAPGRRRKTELDTRTVVAADYPATPLDARSNIPAYMPLDVLSARLIIPRDMPVHALDTAHTIPTHVPLTVLGAHVAVPKDARLPEIEERPHPMLHPAEMPDVLEPDIMTTGEVNLLSSTPRGLRDEERWVLRGASAILHAVAILILFLIPTLFSPRQPTQAEIISAAHSLGDLYMPPDLKSALAPRPKAEPKSPAIHIDPKVIRQLAPPAPSPSPDPIAPPAVVRDQPPKESIATSPNPIVATPPKPEPVKPTPTLEPVQTPNLNPNGLKLPKFSAGRSIEQSLSDVQRSGGAGPSIASQGRIPGARPGGGGFPGGGGGGQGEAGAGLQMLTDTQGVDFRSYLDRVYVSVKRNWFAIMPESAIMGDQGIVSLKFKIYRDGTVIAEDPELERSSGKLPLDRAAMSSIRASSPFEPLPPAFSGPYIELRFIYFYNLPINTPL
jgi:TonB family protein